MYPSSRDLFISSYTPSQAGNQPTKTKSTPPTPPPLTGSQHHHYQSRSRPSRTSTPPASRSSRGSRATRKFSPIACRDRNNSPPRNDRREIAPPSGCESPRRRLPLLPRRLSGLRALEGTPRRRKKKREEGTMRAEKREDEPSNLKEIKTWRSTFIYPGAADDSLLLNESPAVPKGPYTGSGAVSSRTMDDPRLMSGFDRQICGTPSAD